MWGCVVIDPRTAWYRQRAEEHGNIALWLMSTYPVEHAEDILTEAREAAHYANLVLGPDVHCQTCQDTGFVAYWDGSNYAGEGCPDC